MPSLKSILKPNLSDVFITHYLELFFEDICVIIAC